MIDPFTAPRAWAVMSFAGMEMPGLASVSGLKRSYAWEKKKGKGTQGATLIYQGSELAEFKSLHKIWTPLQFELWQPMLELLTYSPEKGKVPVALHLSHPALAWAKVSACVVKDIGTPEHKGSGMWEFEIEWIEYAPPPPVPVASKPTSGPDAAKGTTPVDPELAAAPGRLYVAKENALAAYKVPRQP